MRIPGQVPGRSPLLFPETPIIDPVLQQKLTTLPNHPPEALMDRPTQQAAAVARNVGMVKALEDVVTALIRKHQHLPNRLQFAQAVYEDLQKAGLNPQLLKYLGERAVDYYNRLRKAQFYSVEDLQKAQRDFLPGGRADNVPLTLFNAEDLEEGTKHEMEHTSSKTIAREIASDHLMEDPDYYRKLRTLEKGRFEPGGKYHMRVTRGGKRRYYYDSKKYEETHGLHHTSDQVVSNHVADQVHAFVSERGEVSLQDFGDLVKKHTPKRVHDAVRAHVDAGTLSYADGKFRPGKKGR
jgi:nucleoid DNA-binding protein